MIELRKELLLESGFIAKAYGFNGEMVLALDEESETVPDVAEADYIFIEREGLPVPYLIQKVAQRGGNIIIKLESIDDETEAKKFTGNKIYFESNAKKSSSESLKWEDLAGFTVFDKSFGEIGIIEEVQEYPMHYIGLCKVGGKEVLIPLTEEFIEELNEDEKSILMELPPGLLDIYLQ
ncbi:MAG: 16S rRNA processing protein RimM [Bacteroidetes bacterium]|nr:MAG: 16S rRNA processing protein RimM [Bacteroidota bacterium]REK05094.1 MAG: 16S rRNA processing protein RimM [Bacteroidota bacterium]REK32500.1 MAG: 16S rRNA processing protein RimM [Bacteroidota bacterium]REK49053.1 MAG: 16S rRNA processing protein RimM [Bacteroidota bacterium]